MQILEFLFEMGIVFIILSLIWGFFMILMTMIAMGERKGIFEENLLKAANYYLLASLSAMVVVAKVNETLASHYGYQIAGLIMLYLYMLGKQERQRMQFMMQGGRFGNFTNIKRTQNKQVQQIYLLATLTLFAASVMYPEIMDNGVNRWFMTAIVDIKDTPIIGWIIKFVGVFFLISIIFRGGLYLNRFLDGLGKPKQSQQNQGNNINQGKDDDDDFDDYEIVE